MRFTSQHAIRASEDFKEILVQLQEQHDISDKELAAIYGVSAMTISRWKNPTDECNMPAFAPSLCIGHDLKYLTFALDIIRQILKPLRCDIHPVPRVSILNGSLSDEIMESIEHLGELAKKKDLSTLEARGLTHHANKIIQAGYAMIAEIEAKAKASPNKTTGGNQ